MGRAWATWCPLSCVLAQLQHCSAWQWRPSLALGPATALSSTCPAAYHASASNEQQGRLLPP